MKQARLVAQWFIPVWVGWWTGLHHVSWQSFDFWSLMVPVVLASSFLYNFKETP